MLGTRAIFEGRQRTGAGLAIARFPERLNMRYRDAFSIVSNLVDDYVSTSFYIHFRSISRGL